METFLPLLMVIPYDQLLGIHSLMAILTEAAKYKANHGTSKFVRPYRLPLYNRNIANNAMTVVFDGTVDGLVVLVPKAMLNG